MMSDLFGEAVCRPLAASFERGDAWLPLRMHRGLCADTRDHNCIAEDGAQATSPDGSDTQRPSLWEQQGQPLALPTECVRCFGLLDGVSVDWCVGCLDYLRGGDAA
jgi:hypothetical protein